MGRLKPSDKGAAGQSRSGVLGVSPERFAGHEEVVKIEHVHGMKTSQEDKKKVHGSGR